MRRMVAGGVVGFWLCFAALLAWRMIDRLDPGAVALLTGIGLAMAAMVPGLVLVVVLLSRGKVLSVDQYLDDMDRHFDGPAVPNRALLDGGQPAPRALLDGSRPVWVLSIDRGFACVVPAEGAPWPMPRRVEVGRLADAGRLIEVQS